MVRGRPITEVCPGGVLQSIKDEIIRSVDRQSTTGRLLCAVIVHQARKVRLPEHTIIEVEMQPEPVQYGIEVQVAIIDIGMISQDEQPATIIYEIRYGLDLLRAVFLLRSLEDKYADSFQGLGGNRPVQYCCIISDGIQISEGGMGQAVVLKEGGVQLMVKSVVCYMAIFLLPEEINGREADDE